MLEPAPDAVPEAAGGFGGRDEGGFGQLVVPGPEPVGLVLGDGWTVHRHGPLRLWDQVEDALTGRQDAGSLPHSGLGLTVDPDGTQRVWLGTADGRSWDLPA